ncbi:hypothetical protein LX36DRAFT_659723, partial [Colletotrichum falcatum]
MRQCLACTGIHAGAMMAEAQELGQKMCLLYRERWVHPPFRLAFPTVNGVSSTICCAMGVRGRGRHRDVQADRNAQPSSTSNGCMSLLTSSHDCQTAWPSISEMPPQRQDRETSSQSLTPAYVADSDPAARLKDALNGARDYDQEFRPGDVYKCIAEDPTMAGLCVAVERCRYRYH